MGGGGGKNIVKWLLSLKFLVGWGGYCPSSIPLALPMPRCALSYLIFHIHDFSAHFSLFTSSSAISLWASESNTLIFFKKIEFIHPEVLKSFTSFSTWALKYFSPTLCIFDIYDLRAFGLSTLMFELSSFSKAKWAMYKLGLDSFVLASKPNQSAD